MWDYCSKSDVAAYTGLSTEDFQDSWSEMVEAMINEHTGGGFAGVQNYTESLDGDGTDTLYLSNRPVTAVSSLVIDSVDLASTEYKFYTAGYIRLVSYYGSAIDRSVGTYDAVFPVGQQNVTVTYSAGETTPEQVRLAAILMVAELANVSRRAGADGSLSVSRATRTAGEAGPWPRSTDISGRLRSIMRNTIGNKWKFN